MIINENNQLLVISFFNRPCKSSRLNKSVEYICTNLTLKNEQSIFQKKKKNENENENLFPEFGQETFVYKWIVKKMT